MLVMMVNFALSIYGLELPPPKPTVTAGPRCMRRSARFRGAWTR